MAHHYEGHDDQLCRRDLQVQHQVQQQPRQPRRHVLLTVRGIVPGRTVCDASQASSWWNGFKREIKPRACV